MNTFRNCLATALLAWWSCPLAAQDGMNPPSPDVLKFIRHFQQRTGADCFLAAQLTKNAADAGLAVNFLIVALGDNDPEVRQQAAEILCHLRPFSAEAIPALEQRLADEDAGVSRQAMLTLATFGPPGKAAVPQLTKYAEKCARDPQQKDQLFGALMLLGHIGPDAKVATPALLKLLDKTDLQGQAFVLQALGRIAPRDPLVQAVVLDYLYCTRSILIPRLAARRRRAAKRFSIVSTVTAWSINDHKQPGMQAIAARVVGQMGPAVKEAVPTLVKLLLHSGQGENAAATDRVTALRCSAAYALANMKEAAQPAVAPLVRVLTDPKDSASVRTAAAVALGKLAPHSKEALPALLDFLKEPTNRLRGETRQAVAAFGKEAVPSLIRMLQTGSPDERDQAVDVLALMGREAAAAALPVLRTLAQDRRTGWAAKRTLSLFGEPIPVE